MLIIILLVSFVWMFFQYCTMYYGPDSWVVMFSCMGIQSRGTPTFLCIIFNHYCWLKGQTNTDSSAQHMELTEVNIRAAHCPNPWGSLVCMYFVRLTYRTGLSGRLTYRHSPIETYLQTQSYTDWHSHRETSRKQTCQMLIFRFQKQFRKTKNFFF